MIAQNRGAELDAITDNIVAMGLPTHQPATGHGASRTQNVALRDSLAACGRRAHEKRIPAYVHDWGPATLRAFLESYVDGDGSRRRNGNHCVIYTTSPQMADDLQILAIKAGWSANIRVDDRVGLERRLASGQVFRNARPCYIVSLVKTRTHPLVNHNGARSDGWEHYRGNVYCVKVPNGLLFVRRNGKPVVSGNTHELVRHRAGSAFSQESLRYVRLTDIGFRVPAALEPVRERVLAIVETLEEFQRDAAQTLGLDEDGVPFHVKKEATSALRRLAPLGLSTDIIWTREPAHAAARDRDAHRRGGRGGAAHGLRRDRADHGPRGALHLPGLRARRARHLAAALPEGLRPLAQIDDDVAAPRERGWRGDRRGQLADASAAARDARLADGAGASLAQRSRRAAGGPAARVAPMSGPLDRLRVDNVGSMLRPAAAARGVRRPRRRRDRRDRARRHRGRRDQGARRPAGGDRQPDLRGRAVAQARAGPRGRRRGLGLSPWRGSRCARW